MEKCLLVSVGIATYNSSKYIIDALESVKVQTYKNIELIVSDDCSTDNTVEVCRKWIDENRSSFVNTKLITVESNTGTSGNVNRIIDACQGEWLKLCAGDDALFPDCIEKFINFIRIHPGSKAVVGKIREYKNTIDENNVVEGHMSTYNDHQDFYEMTADEQFKKMIHGNAFIPPSVIYNLDMVRGIGGCDEKYNILDDFPLYLKVLKGGYKFYRMNELVCKYRTSDTNVFGRMDLLFNYKHQYYDYLVRKDLCFPYYTIRERIRSQSRLWTYWIMNKMGLVIKNRFNMRVRAILSLFFDIITFDITRLLSFLRSTIRKLILKNH